MNLRSTDQKSQLIGCCESIENDTVKGWAFDANHPNQCVVLFVFIGKKKIAEITCDKIRSDVKKAVNLHRSNVGFLFKIPEVFVDGKSHELVFYVEDGSILPIYDFKNSQLVQAPLQFTLKKDEDQAKYFSYIDGWKDGGISGWVQKQDLRTGKFSGNCQIMVVMNGREWKTISANRYRGDVASALNGVPNCGFRIVIPPALRVKGKVIFEFIILPEHYQLQGSPYETTLIDDQLEVKIRTIADTLEGLYKEIVSLRDQVKNLIPYPEYILDDYASWAKQYYSALPIRLSKLLNQLTKIKKNPENPLVSVICPIYKPQLDYFIEAVHSILNQTYQNWELLLIDDGGKSTEIRQQIVKFKKLDSRIKAYTLKENKGIATATNVGIKKAVGEWIVFFDHDDALVPQALEMMVVSAQLSKGTVLYSDEDKISATEGYVEPNFKPDFNYRYLLGCNYICHMVMVRADILQQVGLLRSKYNGAQDHDLLLRLSEIVPPHQFHHVREVLYHWRMTPNSTAESVEHKQYAVKAGINCVSDHLKRINKPARVSSIKKVTLYKIEWSNKEEPSVTIIIPFRDQIDITRRCIQEILSRTAYKNYTILLINNNSETRQAKLFVKECNQHQNITILQINEAFNFSRLNNLATQQAKSDFYFFMNNDVFVQDASWLNTIVNEAVSFEDVAIVGGKLLYANGLIQHGGVIVGKGVVAEHMHRGLPKDEYGYAGRAIVSQELSAVTAAAMLIKSSVFHEVGGFDEQHLKVAYNDVDLCLRVREAGYRVIFSADFMAIHQESVSRGSDDQTDEHQDRFLYEVEYIEKKWENKKIYQNDPAYSSHFLVKPQLFYELASPIIDENISK